MNVDQLEVKDTKIPSRDFFKWKCQIELEKRNKKKKRRNNEKTQLLTYELTKVNI